MEVSQEIERMKKLTDITNKIELLKAEMENLLLNRDILINGYRNATITACLNETDEKPVPPGGTADKI